MTRSVWTTFHGYRPLTIIAHPPSPSAGLVRNVGLAAASHGLARYVVEMRLRITCLLPCSLVTIGHELTKQALFHYVDAPVLAFVPVAPDSIGERWEQRPYRFALRVGMRLPIGEHTVDARLATEPDPDRSGPQLVWHDAGFSDLISVWDHRILLEDFRGMTRYTDQVEIHAGPLTLPAWLFARVLYTNRQRRLSRVAASGFTY